MFNHWVVPCNCRCCSFLGNMGGSTNPVAQLTLSPPIWRNNVRKRQFKKQCTDSRGKVQSARSVKAKKDCSKFKCSLNLREYDRSNISKEFWTLNKERKNSEVRNWSHLPCHGTTIRVCKALYLNTLNINHRRICMQRNWKKNMQTSPLQADVQLRA